jgi:hypothetical protein
LPQVSNREDLLLTTAIWDDDTGTPVDFSGRTLAVPGNFTGSNWNVVDGPIITSSTTMLTIPDYPIGTNTISLTVGTNLGILPADFITIADPTGHNTMFGNVLTYAPTTGALVVQIGSTFEFEIRELHPRHHHNDGFTAFGDLGVASHSAALIIAQLGSGITIVDVGTLQILIPVMRLQILRGKTYSASLIATDGVNTRQLFIGRLPVLYGGVHRFPMPVAPALAPVVTEALELETGPDIQLEDTSGSLDVESP